ncbi:hypothetical protein D9756_005296 [Leucocoprinus leucothites]|uniref:Transcriptional coactivator p15 (PC4) C-terminal domain-containing protein n=1 Tax=Leucocoprinus leucothites TaxID=201217 RepID=A0A8H5FZW2_9AGAR|nr:hypothetical protein D9756_005296 [Leucoagaricus leucothites]
MFATRFAFRPLRLIKLCPFLNPLPAQSSFVTVRMVKRKAGSTDSEDEAQFSHTSSEPKQKSKPPPKKVATSKPDSASLASSNKKSEGKEPSTGTVQKNSEGDNYVDLGKKKRATVRSFKDIPLLDIREFYGAGSEEKPGKKGISLTLEQWQVLKANVDAIDELFSNLTKSPK